jgi:hypothetical protein
MAQSGADLTRAVRVPGRAHCAAHPHQPMRPA